MSHDWVLPQIDLTRCSRCGLCVQHCPEHAVSPGDAGPVFLRPLACTYCGTCEALCSAGAIARRYVIVWEHPDRQS